MKDSHEPIIVGLFCHWCAYRAADVAGMSRTHYSANLRAVMVMCSGRVDPEMVVKALREGADGVLIVGCHPGSCHYVDGNVKALRRYTLLSEMLWQMGIERERVQLFWTAASEGAFLASAVDRMTEQLRKMGPLRWREAVLPGKGPDRRKTGADL